MGREMGGGCKREGIYVYLWLIHVEVWQKTTTFCKAIIFNLKINNLKKPRNHIINILRRVKKKIMATMKQK